MIKEVTKKSLKIKPSGRSSDFISPGFGWGCLYNCSYCYMKRHKPKGLSIAKNTHQILTEINTHAIFAKESVEKPNQTHSKYITYDIGNNEDFAFHLKHHNWKEIFNFFKSHDDILGTFATKYVNPELLKYNPKEKIRIRFSMIPENKRKLHEPETSTILERIKAIDKFKKAGYDIHLNFSPIIVYKGWLDDYEELFTLINDNVLNKNNIFAECAFLTHSKEMHYNNIIDGKIKEEEDLWRPEMQEKKASKYGGENLKYRNRIKDQFIDTFIKEHNDIIPWNKIKYIF